MAEDNSQSIDEGASIQSVHGELTKDEPSRWERILEKFLLAAIGSVPWVGGFIAAAASIPKEEVTDRKENLQTKWLEEHQGKLGKLRETLDEISQRFKLLGTGIEERIQSQEYLALVRQAFRAWDRSETEEKRRYTAMLLSNAAGRRLCSDDVLRLFISWIDLYHESHFAVIREIFQNPGVTRFGIWTKLYGALPREDSAEADLFKLLIRDLSTGGVLRIARDTTEDGRFLRKQPERHHGHASTTVESAFESSKPYLLTELGKQFVHYTMNEIVPRISPAVP
jgi:hypothetical protein